MNKSPISPISQNNDTTNFDLLKYNIFTSNIRNMFLLTSITFIFLTFINKDSFIDEHKTLKLIFKLIALLVIIISLYIGYINILDWDNYSKQHISPINKFIDLNVIAQYNTACYIYIAIISIATLLYLYIMITSDII